MLRVPRHLPSFEMILADLPVTHKELARLLGVTERAIRRWKANGEAPRAIILALFWQTTWGRSEVDADSFNRMQLLAQENAILKTENRRLAAAMHDMDTLDGEAVNSPAFYRA